MSEKQLDFISGAQMGENLAAEGAERAADGAGDSWREEATEALRCLCMTQATFTSDDLYERAPWHREMRALGAIMRKGLSFGWMENTGRTEKSRIAHRHRQIRPVWRSLIYRGTND